MMGLDLNAGALAPVADEVALTGLPVDGAVPPALAGTLMRNGPNPLSGRFEAQGVLNWWPEAAMLHAVSFADGRALGYCNRWVRTRRWQDHVGASSDSVLVDTNPNVNVLAHGGEILALAEGGPPLRVDRQANTLGPPRVHGLLADGMTAHPKVDPQRDELRYFHLGPGGLRYGVVDAAGRRTVEQPVPLGPGGGAPGMMHDMAITATHSVLMDLNVGFDFALLERGYRIPVRWQPERRSRLGVMPRQGGEVRWLEIEPCFIQHVVNAWDTGPDGLVMDVVRYPWYFRLDDGGGYRPDPLGVLWRFEIDLRRGAVTERALTPAAAASPAGAGPLNVELPRINESRTGQLNRFTYAVLQPSDVEMRGVVKFDAERGALQIHPVAPGDQNSEAVFVPDPAGTAEDDGWLLVCVYRQATHSTEIRVLDARDIREPLATVALGRRIPAGFHGAWIPA